MEKTNTYNNVPSISGISGLLFSPNKSITDVRQRRNAQLAAIISLSLIIIFSVYMVNASLSGEPSSRTDLISYIILWGIYIFSRTRIHHIAIWLMMLMVPTNTFLNVWLGTTYEVNNTLYFLALGYGLATIFLKHNTTVLFLVGNLVALMLTPSIAPEGLITRDMLNVHITINVLLGVVSIIANRHKQNIEEEREEEDRRNNAAALTSLSRALEVRHNETANHASRAVELTLALAKHCGISNTKQLRQISEGAILHDIGKIAIPDHILLKEGKLTEEEWAIIKTHPKVGYELMKDFDFLKDSLAIPLYHHERYDGSGYPFGFKGDRIPLEARIFAIIDVYDALLENRPYRGPWPIEKVIDHFKENRGILYDPEILDHFFEMIEDMD
jgi:hypothetical protein